MSQRAAAGRAAETPADGPPARSRPRPLRVASAQPPASPAAIVLVAAAAVAALYFGREVFVPLALALLLSFALSPIVTRLRRVGLGRAPSVLLVVSLALALVAGLAWLVASQAVSLAADLPRYEYNLRQKVRVLRQDAAAVGGGGVLEETADMLRRMGEEMDGRRGATGGTEGPARTTTAAPAGQPRPVRPVPVEVHEPPDDPLATLGRAFEVVGRPLATAGLMLLFVVFMLLQREDLRDRFIRLFGSRDVHRTTEAMSDAGGRIGRFLLMQLLINCAFGALFGAGLWLIGVPTPLLWGLIAAVLRFVPYVGAPAAMLLPLAVSLAVDSGWTMPLAVLGLFLAVEVACAYVMEPLLYGSSTGLSPAAIVVAAAFWTVLWGPVGLLLSTPLTACLVVIGRHVPQLGFLEVIFGNRQVLPPATRFYQRLLADDPGEAAELLEEHAREHGLLSAFDEVALPALGLVEADRRRGAVTRERQRQIAEEAAAVADEAAGEAAAPRDRPGAEILCVAARPGLDEAAAGLLAALLRQHRYDAALAAAPFEAAGREPPPRPGRADGGGAAGSEDGVRLVCLSRVGDAGAAGSRRVARRLRETLGPEVPVLLGLWGADRGAADAAALPADPGQPPRFAFDLEEALGTIRELLGEPPPAAVPPAASAPAPAPAVGTATEGGGAVAAPDPSPALG